MVGRAAEHQILEHISEASLYFICASAIVLISRGTPVRGKKKITLYINIYAHLLGTCIICTATLCDKIPTADTITSEDI